MAQILIGCAHRIGALGLLAALACGADDRPSRPSADAGSGSGGAGAGPGGAAGGGAGGGSDGADPLGERCAPRQGCQRLCAAFGADPSACGLGNARQCGCQCEERFDGPCPEELEALLACAGESPRVDCRARGRIIEGCEQESFALEACDFQAREQLCAGAYPDCTPYCRSAALAFCPLGPESAASCLCGCEATLVTQCASEFDAFMTCTASAPAFSCDAAGRIVAGSCSAEWAALSACQGVPVE